VCLCLWLCVYTFLSTLLDVENSILPVVPQSSPWWADPCCRRIYSTSTPHYCLLLLPVYNIWLSQDVLKCQDICALMHTHLCMYASHLYMLYVHIVTRVQVCMHACMHISGYICACQICTNTDMYAQILCADMYAHTLTVVSCTLEATSQILARVVALLSCMRYHDLTRG